MCGNDICDFETRFDFLIGFRVLACAFFSLALVAFIVTGLVDPANWKIGWIVGVSATFLSILFAISSYLLTIRINNELE
jgi:hypothetical protein